MNKKIPFILSIIALAVSLAAIYLVLSKDTDDANAGLIISSLSVLVTALVGWQIYSLIDLRSYQTRMQDIENKYNSAIEKLTKNDYISRVAAFEGLSEIYKDLTNCNRDEQYLMFRFIYWKSLAIAYKCESHNDDYIHKQIMVVAESVKQISSDLSDDAKSVLIKPLNQLLKSYLQYNSHDAYSQIIERCIRSLCILQA